MSDDKGAGNPYGQPQYPAEQPSGQQGYPAQQPYGGAPYGGAPYGGAPYGQANAGRWNVLAIVGFVLSFFVSLVGLILGIIALVQIRRRGGRGRGLAIAAVIIGAVFLIIGIFGEIALFSHMGSMENSGY